MGTFHSNEIVEALTLVGKIHNCNMLEGDNPEIEEHYDCLEDAKRAREILDEIIKEHTPAEVEPTVAIVRDTSTGDCYPTDFNIDTHRIEELGYELAGFVSHKDVPEYTTCERVGCDAWIMIDPIEGGAPEYCSDHASKYDEEGDQ